jgi:hypothetical protein
LPPLQPRQVAPARQAVATPTHALANGRKAFRTEVRDCGSLRPAPEPLDRVELRRIGGKPLDREPTPVGVPVLLDLAAAMRLQAVPDQDDRRPHVAPQVAQEADHFGPMDGPPGQSEGRRACAALGAGACGDTPRPRWRRAAPSGAGDGSGPASGRAAPRCGVPRAIAQRRPKTENAPGELPSAEPAAPSEGAEGPAEAPKEAASKTPGVEAGPPAEPAKEPPDGSGPPAAEPEEEEEAPEADRE